jgi:hypothetical protein
MNIVEKFLAYKDVAEACYNPSFFAKERVLGYASRAAVEIDHYEMLAQFISSADEETLHFMWHYYYFLYCTDEDFILTPHFVEEIKTPESVDAKLLGCVRAVVYLLAVDNLEKWTEGKDVPKEKIIEGYFDRYRNMAMLNRLSHNTPAFFRLSYFLYSYSKPAILRVGRFNFQYTEYKNICEMYEDSKGKRIFAALPNYTYNQKGFQEKDGFIPVYEQTNGILTAHIFNDDGSLSLTPRTLSVDNLKLLLKPGDRVLTIHIPEDGPMLYDDVLRSLEEAERIFTKYFPPHKAIVCNTWFLDPALRRDGVIKNDSNMAKFADLFDVISGTDNYNNSIFEHVFKVKKQPLESLVPTNGFTERLVNRAMRGEKLYWGYGALKKSVSDNIFKLTGIHIKK